MFKMLHVTNNIKDMPQIEQNKMKVYKISSKSIIRESLSLDYARHKTAARQHRIYYYIGKHHYVNTI